MNDSIAGVGAIFIDDIVLPDGHTHMNRLGGGVIHALMGAALWGAHPGLVALAGNDLSDELLHDLSRYMDTRGLYLLDAPQIRAWQIFEWDGTRRELYRTSVTEPFIRGAQPKHFPDEYNSINGLYLLQNFEGLLNWRNNFDRVILWEPLQQIMQHDNQEQFRTTLKQGKVDIVSSNLAEARGIYGDKTPGQLVNAMLRDGARVAVVRMGSQGSMIGDQEGGQYIIPALQVTQIIDQTGAGNTYNGALLWGILQRKSLAEAGAMAATAASFCLENIGVFEIQDIPAEERQRRFESILGDITSTFAAR